MSNCSVTGCEEIHHARSYCKFHYETWARTGNPLSEVRPWEPRDFECSIEGCNKVVLARGFCSTHYHRWRNYGNPLDARRAPNLTVSERFFQYVTKTKECWLWTGAISHGYGSFYINIGNGRRKYVMAHRFSYEMTIGPVPEGKTLDHTCHSRIHCTKGKECIHRRCVNPDHLQIMTLKENIQKDKGIKTHCPQGHEYTPENTYVNPKGSKVCLICRRASEARYRSRKRGS